MTTTRRSNLPDCPLRQEIIPQLFRSYYCEQWIDRDVIHAWVPAQTSIYPVTTNENGRLTPREKSKTTMVLDLIHYECYYLTSDIDIEQRWVYISYKVTSDKEYGFFVLRRDITVINGFDRT